MSYSERVSDLLRSDQFVMVELSRAEWDDVLCHLDNVLRRFKIENKRTAPAPAAAKSWARVMLRLDSIMADISAQIGDGEFKLDDADRVAPGGAA